jgi:predicted PurR-regulated permease PerM
MKNHLNTIFLTILLLTIGYFSYLVFAPFLTAIFLAFILSQLFKGWYERFLIFFKGKSPLAALFACVSILLLFIIPIILIFSLVVAQINQLLGSIDPQGIASAFQRIERWPILQNFTNNGNHIIPFSDPDKLSNDIQRIGNVLFQAVKQTYQGASHFVFISFVLFFTLYYFFKDQNKIIKNIVTLIPLKSAQQKMLFSSFIEISRATLKGSLVIAMIQGTLVGITFAIAGVPSYILWAIIAVFFSLIPMVGTAILWVPAGLIIFLLGHYWQGLFILAAGILVISTIDNFLRPKLVGNATSLHPLLVFFSSLGGIFAFGALGFLIGPIIIALLVTLLQILKAEYKNELSRLSAFK